MNSSTHVGIRVGWWCGIIAMVMIVVGFFAIDKGGTTPADGPLDVLAREITDQRGRIVVGNLLGMIGALALVGFAAALRMRLTRDGQTGEMLGLIAYAFGVIMTVGALAYGSLQLAATTISDPTILTEAIRAITIVEVQVSTLLGCAAIGLVATMSVASFLVGLLSRTMAWVGAILAVAAAAFIPTDHGAFGLALFLWLAVSCVLLLREKEPPETRERVARGGV